MRILLFHPTLLPPRNYGGVERVLLWLAQGLRERGHRVWVAALAGSQLPEGCELLEVQARHYAAEELNSIFHSQISGGPDLIHFMAPLNPSVWNGLDYPAILTVHGNAQPGEVYPKNSVFLSADHARRHGAQKFIYNGINPSEFQFTPHMKSQSYLFLSKTQWSVKNLKGALRVSRASGIHLKIAGGNRPYWQRFLCSFNPRLEWVGPVSGVRKAELLAQAKALIFPVLWPEPFGLVVVEALISGTPVLASRRGSLPELIPPDVGIFLNSDEEWIEFLRRGRIPWDPDRCRQWALSQFHYLKMASEYELAYQQVIQGAHLNEQPPMGPRVAE